jgi:hypothetical protein
MTDKEDTPLPAEIERRKRLAKLIGQPNTGQTRPDGTPFTEDDVRKAREESE